MAKLILSAYPCKVDGMFLSISFSLSDPNALFPARTVEIKRVADAAAALESYKAEVAAVGKPAAISMRIARGDRSPPGFKKLKAAHHYETVNC